jgi:HEAT repeat protein
VLADARAALKAGRPERALTLLATATTPDALRVKIVAAVEARRIDVALDAYAARMAVEPAHDPELLRAIAEGYLAQHPPADPRLAAITRCERDVGINAEPEAPRRTGRTPACVADMKTLADDTTLPTGARAAAALIMVRAGDTKAGARITGLAVTPVAAERRALFPVLQQAPASVALPVLMAYLDDDDLGIQHQAAAAMAALPTEESKRSLQGYLAINFRRIARAPTIVSLATMGDAQALRELRGLLPQLTGLELVNGAAALAAIDDPRGVDALERVAQGDHEGLRALAGAKLVAKRPATARAVFERGMGHASSGVRLATLDAYATTALVDESRLVALMRDRDPSMRTRAADLLWRRR